jgi:hypothetical protein
MKITLALFAATLVFGFSLAQNEVYQPSCSLTLKIQPDTFIETYTVKNNDQSEVGYDQAAIYWANCKQKENEARVAKLPALKTKLANLYRSNNEFFNAETELAYLAGGGGTMFPHGRARFQPSIENHFSGLIGLLTSKSGASKSAAITARYNIAKQKLEKRLNQARTNPKPFTEGYTASEILSKKTQWLEYAKNYALQYSNIRKNIGAGVDLSSTIVLEFLATGLWAEEL